MPTTNVAAHQIAYGGAGEAEATAALSSICRLFLIHVSARYYLVPAARLGKKSPANIIVLTNYL